MPSMQHKYILILTHNNLPDKTPYSSVWTYADEGPVYFNTREDCEEKGDSLVQESYNGVNKSLCVQLT